MMSSVGREGLHLFLFLFLLTGSLVLTTRRYCIYFYFYSFYPLPAFFIFRGLQPWLVVSLRIVSFSASCWVRRKVAKNWNPCFAFVKWLFRPRPPNFSVGILLELFWSVGRSMKRDYIYFYLFSHWLAPFFWLHAATASISISISNDLNFYRPRS